MGSNHKSSEGQIKSNQIKSQITSVKNTAMLLMLIIVVLIGVIMLPKV
jgi:hypothetical protein